MTHIVSFSIQELNDFYTYKNCTAASEEKDLLVLYGDNGCGKTTILTLLYHLLSSHPKNGHLSAIANVAFNKIEVFLSNGSKLAVKRVEGTRSVPLFFSATDKTGKTANYTFIPEKGRDRFFQAIFETAFESSAKENIRNSKSSRNIIQNTFFSNLRSEREKANNSNEKSHSEYIGMLNHLGVTCYFIAADRRIRNDHLDEKYSLSLQIEGKGEDVIKSVRTQYLSDAFKNASKHINQKIIAASNIGHQDTNQIFINLLTNLDRPLKNNQINGFERSIENLRKIEKSNAKLSKLGILPDLETSRIISFAKNYSGNQSIIAETIINHYTDSVQIRLNALEPLGNAIRYFLTTINRLIRHKTLRFSPDQGFIIKGATGEGLNVEQLSSGEQQLLLMFFYLLTAEPNSIFIVDEPEISLNVKWQRVLIDAMRGITKTNNIQLLIATHSIELLSQYYEKVIHLETSNYFLDSVKNDDSEEDY